MKQHEKKDGANSSVIKKGFSRAKNLEAAAAAGKALLKQQPDRFLSARELGINETERDALIMTLGLLESGKINSKQFNMSRWFTRKDGEGLQGRQANECGTTACLAGWANFVSDGKAFPEVAILGMFEATTALQNSRPVELLNLFGLGSGDISMGLTNPKKGAAALRNFLTTGRANWRGVIFNR